MRIVMSMLALLLTAGAQAQTVENDFGLNDQPGNAQPFEPLKVIYSGAPIPLTLTAGVERRIVFDGAFEISIDSTLSKKDIEAFKPQIYGNNLLLTVAHPVSIRLVAKLLSNAEVIPIDLRVIEEATDNHPVAIMRQSVMDAQQQYSGSYEPPTVPVGALHTQADKPKPGYVDLIRYAAQRMYSPKRYHDDVEGAKIIEFPRSDEPVRLMRFGAVETRPVIGWQVASLYVSAIEVANNMEGAVDLDPRLLIGNWRAASFHHNRIGPVGTRVDKTMLYLVSDQPFDDALGLRRVSKAKTTEVDHGQTER